MKKVFLTTAILTLTLLAGCGKTNDTQTPQEQLSESQQTDSIGTDFGLENLSDRVFYFSSGAGGWYTELFIDGDGTFRGTHMDSNMGDIGDDYPGGTVYFCEFTGMFDHLEKIDDFTYKMKMISLTFKEEPEKEEITDGTRYIYSTAYGLDGGEEFYLYLPGAELSALPEEYRNWVGYHNLENTTGTELPFYGLYNINTGDGFSSSEYEKQSLSERIALEISFAEERDAELETQLQSATTQTDMNLINEELFQTWDDTLNIIWKLLAAELDEETMTALKTEEKNWIDFKEAEVEAAGQEFEGGSMQPMIRAMKAAELTKERVYELAKYAE